MIIQKNPIFANRICEPVPSALCVAPEAVPIPYFGDYDNAEICTIGINPSDTEFYKKGVPINNHPCLRSNLGANPGDFLSAGNAVTIIDYYDNYFKSGAVNRWFKTFEKFLNEKECSYYYKPHEKRLCVHFDLVEWTTQIKWSGLPKTIAQTLISADSPFFKALAERLFSGLKPFRAICLDGISVIKAFQVCYPSVSFTITTVPGPNGSKRKASVDIYVGRLGSTKIVGWNLTLSRVPWLAYAISTVTTIP